MPVTKAPLPWIGRATLPRRATTPLAAVPALVHPVPPAPFIGRSRFVLSPLSLTLDQCLFLITAALLCFGLLMVQSADARVHGVSENWLLAPFQNKNAIHALLAMVVLTFLWRLDYRWLLGKSLLRSPAFWLAGITILALAGVFVPGFGKQVNGARRWIGAGALQLQPSELAKLGLVTFIAAYGAHCQASIRKMGICTIPVLLMAVAAGLFLIKPELAAKHIQAFAGDSGAMKFRIAQGGVAAIALLGALLVWVRRENRAWVWGFLPLVTIFGMIAALVLVEDFGTTALVAVVSLVLMVMAGSRLWHVGLLIPPGAFAVWALIFRDPDSFRYKRLMAFANPWADPQGVGYHPIHSLYAIMSGGFWGRGLGNGILKWYLPEDNTDFIFAIICEELGFFGALMVIGLFLALVVIGWRIATRCRHHFGKMVAFGITAIIGLQAAMNIAVVTVSMPTKGIALPFISSGGTGWIMNAAAIGLLMSIERVSRQEARSAAAAGRGAEPALGFPVQVHALPAVPAIAAVPAVPV
jgi:cell division protein FtsW